LYEQCSTATSHAREGRPAEGVRHTIPGTSLSLLGDSRHKLAFRFLAILFFRFSINEISGFFAAPEIPQYLIPI